MLILHTGASLRSGVNLLKVKNSSWNTNEDVLNGHTKKFGF